MSRGDLKLGRPLPLDDIHSAKQSLPCSIVETKKDSRHYQVSKERGYVVRLRGNECVYCAQQVYSESVNDAVRRLYGERYVVEE